MNLSPVEYRQFFSGGVPVANGKLYTYQAGSSTPLATYTDYTGGSENTNPIILDADGGCDLWIAARSYKYVLEDSSGNVIRERDNISIPNVENGFSTGDVKASIKNVADSGWVLLNDTSIGSTASAATGRANDDTEALFLLLWANLSNAYAAVSGGRGATAAADWAADKTINLPKALGRVLGVYGTGSGLTARSLGEYLGTETHTLTEAQLPVVTVVQNAHTHTQNAHHHQYNTGTSVFTVNVGGTDANINNIGTQNTADTTAVNQNTTATNQPFGSGDSHPNMQPTLFLNAMIKL